MIGRTLSTLFCCYLLLPVAPLLMLVYMGVAVAPAVLTKDSANSTTTGLSMLASVRAYRVVSLKVLLTTQ